MKTEKEKLLKETYDKFIQTSLNNLPLEGLEEFIDEQIMGYGTTLNEKVLSLSDYRELVIRQREQGKDIKMTFDTTPVNHRIAENGNSALFVDEILLSIHIENNPIEMFLRISTVLEYMEEKWIVVHWHGSKPEYEQGETDTWHVNEWKQKQAELEKQVEEKTVDLVQKNRELEIETSLERVRAIALSMKEPADMLEVCRIISEQLEILKVKDIRNVQTAIIYELKGTYLNYEYYRLYDKTIITEVDYSVHPKQAEFANQMLKSPEAFFTTSFEGDQLIDWVDNQSKTSQFIDSFLEEAESLNYYFHSIGPVALGISTYSPLSEEDLQIFKRFRNVFELAYRRYLDIKKAEAQAREAQIEAALERIRSKSLGMYKTDDLRDVVSVLFDQMQMLSVDMGFASVSIFIFENDSRNMSQWIPLPDGVKSLRVPYFEHPILSDLFDSKESGADYFAKVYTIEEKNAWLKKGFVLTDYKNLPEEFKTSLLEAPGYAMSTTLAKNSGICIPSFFGKLPLAEDVEIMKRVGKVFEQAYIRFLDLQKAEAQAREAQIENALEKVRSQTMGMQSSEDLANVATVMFDQLRLLGGELFSCGIVLCDENKNEVEQWHSIPGAGMIDPFFVPNNLDYIHQYRYDQWKLETELFSIEIPEDFIVQHFDTMLALPSVKAVWEGIAAKGLALPEIPTWEIDYGGSFQYGYLLISALQPFEQANILPRFAKVFEQTYTRFLDLQKAEAQAREAQIEASLERVRAKSMAMHKSEELDEVIQIIFQELGRFEIDLMECSIATYDTNPKDLIYWSAGPIGSAQPSSVKLQYIDHPLLVDLFNDFESGVQYRSGEFSGEFLKTWWDRIFIETDFKYAPAAFIESWKKIKNIFYSQIAMKHGFLEFLGRAPLPDDKVQILKRFTNVVDLTYTRYDDVVKAEAQAREAQIEAALERVRSRSLAMHKSEELADLSLELVKQVQALGVATWFCAFNIYDDDPQGSLEWGSNGHGTFPKYRTPREGIFLRYYEAGQRGETLLINEIGANECPAHYEYLCTLPGVGEQLLKMKDSGIPFPTSQIDHVAYFKYGYILFITYEPVPESHDIFKRFAKVFQQTYTRFLDLQKAEAQVREAQIEAALEKVRSRSLAMHTANELGDVVAVIVEKLKDLDVVLDANGIVLCTYFQDSKDVLHWIASPDFSFAGSYLLPYFDHPIFNDAWQSKESGDEYFSKEYSVELKNSFFKYAFEHSDYRHFPEDFKQWVFQNNRHILSFAWQKNSAILIPSHTGVVPSEDDVAILKRFVKVFEQSYTRFLDLQKAETQAREAQIEVALERARTQSMLMQHSDELNRTSQVFHEQLQILGVDSEFSYLWLPHEKKAEHLFWATWQDDQKDSTSFNNRQVTYPLDKTEPSIEACYVAWESGTVVHINYVAPTEVEDYFTTWTELLHGIEKFNPELFAEGLYYVDAYMKYGCFGIVTRKLLTESEQQILTRFTKEFERAYTRFLDLQKAEEQAREARIEAALEKVRSKAMAMNSSEDLAISIDHFFHELKNLNIKPIRCGVGIKDGDARIVDVTVTSAVENGEDKKITGKLTLGGHPILDKVYEALQLQAEYFPVLRGKEINEYYHAMNPDIEFPNISEDDTQYGYYFHYKEGGLFAWTKKELLEEEINIFRRFKSVLSLTYRRYIDIKEAEAQAREAQIETALERIRARTMGMQRSDELQDAAMLLFQQVEALGISVFGSGFNIWDDDRKAATAWMAGKDRLQPPFKTSSAEDIFLRILEAAKRGDQLFVEEQGSEELEAHYKYMASIPVFKGVMDKMAEAGLSVPTFQIMHCAYFNQGYLMFISFEPVSSAYDIFQRFAKVFEQTYTRFLDLQKAEAQAREVQIELSLERIRSKVTAMQESTDLLDIVVTMRTEFVSLGHEAHYFWYMRYLPEIYEKAMTSGDGTKIGMIMSLPRHIHGDIKLLDDWEKSDKPTVVFAMDVETAVDYIQKMITLGDFVQVDPQAPTLDDIRHIGGLTFIMARTHHGEIGFSLPGTVPDPPQESLDTLVRFAGVFDLAYSRFEDLKNAEMQNRETQIELALERVRARTMAMQKSNELARTAAHLFEQLNELGIKPYRCNIAIVNIDKHEVKLWSTTNSGNVIPTSSSIPLEEYHVFKEMYEGWKTQKSNHIIKIEGQSRIAWTKYISKYLPFEEYKPKNINKKTLLNEAAIFSNFYFRQGFFVIHTKEEINEEDFSIIQRFSNVFEQTYTRFLDLENAELQNKIIQAENERKTQELEEARQLQLAMLPKELPQLKNFEIAVYMQTATEVGGDYYDFNVDDNGTLTTVIGDATGHGMKAGTIVTITKSLFNSLGSEPNILETFKKVSQVIKDMKFRQLSMCLMMLKISGNKMLLSSAAMPPALIYRKNEKLVEEIVSNGMPLGAMVNFPYKLEETKVKTGDTIFLMSDGFPELMNEKKGMYGYEKVKSDFLTIAEKSPNEIIEALKNSASNWVDGNDPDDDVTFVVIKVK